MKINKKYFLMRTALRIMTIFAISSAYADTKNSSKKQSKKKTVAEILKQADSESTKAKVTVVPNESPSASQKETSRKKNGKVEAPSVATNKPATSLPSANMGFKQEVKPYNLESVKPPQSADFMKSDGKLREKTDYEKILDQQIRELYKLTQKFKTSPNRGELWLRLAELFVEKATLIDSIKQDEYDIKLREFQSGQLKSRPKLEVSEARDYNKKAIQLYEWFQRDFPKDEKISQALFFLGYNHFEMGDYANGVSYFDKLNSNYPSSPFLGESHFALGEHYFDNEKWAQAYKEYSFLIEEKKHRLHTFALYKGAWCLFRLGKPQQGMKYLEYIIKIGNDTRVAQLTSRFAVNRNRLESEALRDIVVFYVEAGDSSKALAYFKELVGKDYPTYLEKLAYQYADRGYKDASRDIFKILIAQAPTATKSFEHQYQVVQNYYYGKDILRFKTELYSWVRDYGKNGAWFATNKKNQELIETSNKLRETTLRNYVLQQHQTAQNSRAPFSQAQANDGYQLYFSEFSEAPSAADMHFFYGELLYDMGKYDEAASHYKWIVDNAPKNKFFSKAAQNMILAADRSTPTDQEMQQRVGSSTDPIPLDPKVDRFIKAGQWFVEKFPESEKVVEIKFRIGRLYYQHNQFDSSIKYFRDVALQHSRSKYAEYSGNLLLDIYSLKKDYNGLEKTGNDLLSMPAIAASKTGQEIREVVEKVAFKRGQDLEIEGKYAESAQSFEAFSKKSPRSSLAFTAMVNAGINYERAGLNGPAISVYQNVISASEPAAEKLKPKVRRLLAKQYQDSAQFEEAARLFKKASEESPNEPLAPNWMFNAAVLYGALGKYIEANTCYEAFTKLSKKSAEKSEAVFSIAQNHRKLSQHKAAIDRYTEYVETGGSDQEKVVESAYWNSKLYELVKNESKASEWRKRTLAIQSRFSPRKQGIGASYAASLQFADAESTFRSLQAISFPADPKKQKEAVDKKIALLTKLTTELVDVIKFDSAEEIVKALSLLGEANEDMAQAIWKAPIPAGLNEDEKKQYIAGVERFAEPFSSKAKDSFKAAVDRGMELEVYNEGYKVAYEFMSRTEKKAYYSGGEFASDIRLVNWIGN